MNTSNYFADCQTTDRIKTRYRELAKQFHPDILTGSKEAMQKINEAYHAALKNCHGEQKQTHTGQSYSYKYEFSFEQELIDKVQLALSAKIKDVEVGILGSWVWIETSSLSQFEMLKLEPIFKQFGFRYQQHRNAFSWHKPNRFRKTKRSGASFDELKSKYGYSNFNNRRYGTLS